MEEREKKADLKLPLPSRALSGISRLISRVRGISMNAGSDNLLTCVNVLAENRGHVKRGRWRRSGSEGCARPCSRVIAAAARLPRPHSLACTHADRTVHRQCIVIIAVVVVVVIAVAPCVRADHWECQCEVKSPSAAKKRSAISLHVVNFTYHPEDTRRNKVSAPSS